MFALGHNGNLVNTEKLAADAGMLEGTVTSDSDLVAELIAAELSIDVAAEQLADLGAPVMPADDGPHGRLERAVATVIPRLEGAFSLVIMDEARVIGVLTPWVPAAVPGPPGCLRPRRVRHGGWVLASETPALDIVGATFVRELEPGEMVVIDDGGVRSLHPHGADAADPDCACSSSSTSPGPTAGCTGRACTRPASGWGSSSPGRRPSTPTW